MLSCRVAVAVVLLLACCTTFIIAIEDVVVFDHDGSSILEHGDKCWDQSTNRGGRCLNMTRCISAIEAYKTKGATRPTTCGFEGDTLLVCCAYKDIEGETPPPPLPHVPVSLRQPFMKVACGGKDNMHTANNQPTYDRLGNPEDGYYIAVAGGTTTNVNAWPWTALLGWRENGGVVWRCDGSLINDRWVITAAHCFDRSPPVVVRLGEHDYTNDTDGAPHQDFGIGRYLSYPEYSSGLAYHDLALIELDNPVVFSKEKYQIAPVCLPWGAESTAYLLNRTVYLTGWGATENGGELNPVLQEVGLTIFNSSLCDENYGRLLGSSIEFPRGITTQDFVCAGDMEGGKDACYGDSGGPLQYNSRDLDGWVLTGVVAKGYGCGLADFPGLYTPVHNPRYLLWIRKVAFL